MTGVRLSYSFFSGCHFQFQHRVGVLRFATQTKLMRSAASSNAILLLQKSGVSFCCQRSQGTMLFAPEKLNQIKLKKEEMWSKFST